PILKIRLLDFTASRSSADVERPHGKLGARLTDGLGSYDTDCLPNIDSIPARKVSPAPHRANAATSLTRQHGTNDHAFYSCIFDFVDASFVDLLVRVNDRLIGQRIPNFLESDTA